MPIEPGPTCMWKGDFWPERREQFKLTLNTLKAIIDSCRKDKIAFSPPQWHMYRPLPTIIQCTPDDFAYVGIDEDSICLQQLTGDEVRQIADEAIDFLYRMGRRGEEEEMAEIYDKLFGETGGKQR